jgi:hypothetical protein
LSKIQDKTRIDPEEITTMSKDKHKKIARAILFQALTMEHERAVKKAAKAERDARAKREKRVVARALRKVAAAAGVVAAPIDDYAAREVFVTWTRQEVAQVLGQA